MLRIILVLAMGAFAAPDLKPTFSIRRLGASGPFDVIEIFTVISNIGAHPTYVAPNDYPLVSIGLDSLSPLLYHIMPGGYVLNAGAFASFLDTLEIIPRPFSIHVYADPIKIFDGYAGNNVTSQGYSFHPIILIDTLVIRDTIRTHDTVVVRDTVKYCPPTLAKASQSIEAYRTGPGMDALGRTTKVWARCRE